MENKKFSAALGILVLFSLLAAGCTGGKQEPIDDVRPVGESGNPVEFMDLTWYWIRLDDSAGLNQTIVDNPTLYTLVLNLDGTYAVKADCNHSSGRYTLDGGSLLLAAGPTTLAECGSDSLSGKFLANLGQAAAYVVDGGKLVLDLGPGAGSLLFVPASLMSWPADVDWAAAVDILNTGQVIEIMQTHSLEVTLTLEDGIQILTIEPSLDLIFHEVTLCGELCGEILLITE